MPPHDGVSREVPCSALKGETVPDSLPAIRKSPPTRRGSLEGTQPRNVLPDGFDQPSCESFHASYDESPFQKR